MLSTLKNISLHSLTVLTAAETITAVAIAAVIVAGMLAVSESVVVVALEMIETGSSKGNKLDFCRGRHSNY